MYMYIHVYIYSVKKNRHVTFPHFISQEIPINIAPPLIAGVSRQQQGHCCNHTWEIRPLPRQTL